MNPHTYKALEPLQVRAGQLASLLNIVARSLDAEGQGAVEACAEIANAIADGIDAVPGFIDAQHGRYAENEVAA